LRVILSFHPLRGDEERTMRTMTCRQLGGACDLAHEGQDANEIIKAHDAHLRAAVADGHADHGPALDAMKARWRRPVSGLRWYRQVQRDVAAQPAQPERIEA